MGWKLPAIFHDIYAHRATSTFNNKGIKEPSYVRINCLKSCSVRRPMAQIYDNSIILKL